jgi:DnaJ-class molecular chaperone
MVEPLTPGAELADCPACGGDGLVDNPDGTPSACPRCGGLGQVEGAGDA